MGADLDPTSGIFLDYSSRKLAQLAERIGDCLERLNDEQIWARGGANENAVGNLVLHLCGNVRQWILATVGRNPDVRRRDEEFAARGGWARDQLATQLRSTVCDAVAVLQNLQPERLGERVTVQNYHITVMEAIYSAVEHFSGHTGQILYATKLLTGEDLGYYRHLKGAPAHREPTP
jgi:hypothetical protein